MAWALGRYLVLETLGEGATGQIYRAYDPQLDRRVALKLLKPVPGVDAAMLQSRLLHEAQAMARLSHPHVVAVHDVGTAEGQVFVAMELVEGTTLRAWLEERPRPWREVLAAFLQAGEGLAAAHAAGLVHRDFKPANVVLGRDGVVKVTDFGLAVGSSDFAEGAREPPGTGSGRELDPDRSTSALLVGTPAYMSPEQRLGRPLDARTDQYSFCVALFEGLTGHRPAGPADAHGKSPGHAGPQSVPGWVMRPVLKGLKESPQERHRSMRELLDALAADPARRRTRFLATAALSALVVGALGTTYLWAERRRLLCSGAAAQLTGTWDPTTREAVSHAFLESRVPYAKDVLAGVVRSLDGRARAWTSMNVEACEATRLRGTQSEGLLDRRMACLGRRLEEMRALTAVLAKADAKIVERAGQAVDALPAIGECSSAGVLASPAESPLSPPVRAQAEALDRGLAEAAALRETGQLKQAMAKVRPLADAAAALGSPGLDARARALLAQVRSDLGDFAESERTWMEAVAGADAAQDDALRVGGWTALTRVVGVEQARFRDGEQAAAQANAILVRLGRPPHLEAVYRFALGSLHAREGRQKEAIDELQRAVEQAHSAFDADDTRIASMLVSLGVALRNSGQLAEARTQLQAALDIVERKLGPMHPLVANTLYQLSSVHRRLGNVDLAWDTALRALAAREAVFGPSSTPVGRSLNGLGIMLQEQARYRDAEPYLRRALNIFESTMGPDHPDTAAVMNNLANVVMNWDPGEAQQLRRRALAIQQRSIGPEHLEVANTESNLAVTDFALARHPEALSEVTRAIAIRERQAVTGTEELANDRDLHGEILEATGHPSEGLAEHQRALAIREALHGGTSPFRGLSLTRMAGAYLALEQPGKALALARESLALEQGASIDPTELALTRFVLARALDATHQDPGQAVALAREARSQLAALHVEQSAYTREMNAWLAAHDRAHRPASGKSMASGGAH
ncbi:MAG TPA: serine/threonine-protein kinase [Myxococcaceae bacterium]|nr:serine/threonine-protein kinase [Myxococcaceae bacterium]